MKYVLIRWEDSFADYENNITIYVDGNEYTLYKNFDTTSQQYEWVTDLYLEDGVHELKCQEGFKGPNKITTDTYMWNIYKSEEKAAEDEKIQKANTMNEEEFKEEIKQMQLQASGQDIYLQNMTPHEGNILNFIGSGVLLVIAIIVFIKGHNKWKLLGIIPIIIALIFAKPILADLTRATELKNFYNEKSSITYWNIDKDTIKDYKDSMEIIKATTDNNEFNVSDLVSDYIHKVTTYYKTRSKNIKPLNVVEDNSISKVFISEDCSFLDRYFNKLDPKIPSFERDLITMLEKVFIHKSNSPAFDWYISVEQAKKIGKYDDISGLYTIDLPFDCQLKFKGPTVRKNDLHIVKVDLSELNKDDPASQVYLIDVNNNKYPIHVIFKIKKGLNKNIMTLNLNDGLLFPERLPAFASISQKMD